MTITIEDFTASLINIDVNDAASLEPIVERFIELTSTLYSQNSINDVNFTFSLTRFKAFLAKNGYKYLSFIGTAAYKGMVTEWDIRFRSKNNGLLFELCSIESSMSLDMRNQVFVGCNLEFTLTNIPLYCKGLFLLNWAQDIEALKWLNQDPHILRYTLKQNDISELSSELLLNRVSLYRIDPKNGSDVKLLQVDLKLEISPTQEVSSVTATCSEKLGTFINQLSKQIYSSEIHLREQLGNQVNQYFSY